MVVLDCSVTMSWCFEDEHDETSKELLLNLKQQPAIVPSIWSVEICNVLYNAEKKKRITKEEINTFIKFLNALPIEVDNINQVRINSELLTLCRNYSLSAYDATYLELALQYNIPIYSFDKQLCAAAVACGILIGSNQKQLL